MLRDELSADGNVGHRAVEQSVRFGTATQARG
jgi:hypothetical protein